MIFLQVLVSISKENFLKCSSFLHPEAGANFSSLISRADDLYSCGKERIKLWHLCLVHINELEKLIHCSSEWLKKEFENSKDHPCPKQDLPIYITFFKVIFNKLSYKLLKKQNKSIYYDFLNLFVHTIHFYFFLW